MKHFFDILTPIDHISNGLFAKKPKPVIKGLGDTNTCIPFYQFNGKIIDTSSVSFESRLWPLLWNAAIAAISSLGMPGAGQLFSILTAFDKIINASFYKKQYAANVKQSYEVKKTYQRWALACHMPYCRIADSLINIDFNSTFYDPNLQQNLVDEFLASTIIYNNNRLQKNAHIQTILAAQAITEENFGGLEDMGFVIGGMMIKIPNIESYWMWEQIKISGCGDSLFTIMNRYGKIKNPNKEVVDCYIGNLWSRYYLCANNLDKSTYGRYKNEGYNLENLEGEGWLYLDKPFSQFQSQVKTGTSQVGLKNTALVELPSNLQPPITTPIITPTPTPIPTPAPVITPTNKLTLPDFLKNASIASMGTAAMQFVLLGIGVTFLYNAFMDKDKPKSKQIEPEK